MNRKSRVERIFLAILFCTIAERAIAQVNFTYDVRFVSGLARTLAPQ